MAPMVAAETLKKLRRFKVESPEAFPLIPGPRIVWVSPRHDGEFLKRRLSRGKTREPSDVTRGRDYSTVLATFSFLAAPSSVELGFLPLLALINGESLINPVPAKIVRDVERL